MDIRSYTKQELALLYFPDSSPVVASAHLMRWICRNPDLLKKLHEKADTTRTARNSHLCKLPILSIFSANHRLPSMRKYEKV